MTFNGFTQETLDSTRLRAGGTLPSLQLNETRIHNYVKPQMIELLEHFTQPRVENPESQYNSSQDLGPPHRGRCNYAWGAITRKR